ncbi:MAG: peptidoglycan-binding protein [Oscillatoriales cyanobacterium RM1_1_9]|nr:peptidoglycan-binding protein [Oscillatoriales cyanobacterium RM1_1_9]
MSGAFQQELRALNYYGGPITGFYDQATQTAVVRFQQANRITPTGVIGPTTRTSLFNARLVTASSPTPSTTSTTSAIPTLSSPIIGINSLNLSSDSIRKVQERLRIQGLYYGPISGVYDERTQQAISRAQDLYGVSADTILFGGL